MRKCKTCRQPFEARLPMQVVCGHACALSLAKSKRAKEAKQAQVKERAADRAKRESLKTRSDHLRETQAAFNAMVRKRDEAAGLGCISCGRKDRQAWDAGHYRTVGANPELRFSEVNTWRQCVPCNQHQHGNLIEYRKGLIERVGAEVVEWLEGPHEPKHYTTDELKAMKADFRRKTRELEKQIGKGIG